MRRNVTDTSEGAVQLLLFGQRAGNGSTSVRSNGGAFSDPAFTSNKTVPVHRWVPWIAGFSREFVQSALDRHLHRRGIVLDPFAGVGTTLVEAVLAGHDAVGFEINPYAALACRLKANAYQVDPDLIRDTVQDFREFYTEAIRGQHCPRSKPPAGFKTRTAFYSPTVLHEVLIVQDFIGSLRDGAARDLCRLAFGSTMVTYSNYSYEPSLGRRASAGKKAIVDFPVARTIEGRLLEMEQDVRWMRAQMGNKGPVAQVFMQSFFGARDILEARSVDLIVTSPPYLNNYHYNRNTRPHLYWLGFVSSPSDMRQLEEANFGKYWQTVRGGERLELDFTLPGKELREQLELLRAKSPEKGVYGGSGWANYAVSYFNDCDRFARAAKYVLKRGGTALVVIGNSILQGVMIPTDRYLAAVCEAAGLRVVDIHVPRATRVGNSIIQSQVRVAKAKDEHKLYEAVVELRKR